MKILKKIFRLPLKRSEKPVKAGQYWVAKSHIECERKGTIKKIISVSNTHVKVSSNKGFKGKVCIESFMNDFEIHEALSPKPICKKTEKRKKKNYGNFNLG